MLHGTLDEPIKGHSNIEIRIVEEEPVDLSPNRPAAVGHVLGTNPAVSVYLPMSERYLDRAWSLAASGRLTHGWISLTPPHYGAAAVQSIAFANEAVD
jgi:hypothetical protein